MSDVANRAGVAVRGDTIVILFPRSALSRDDALNLAAWLVSVVLADDGCEDGKFEQLLAAVRAT